MIPVLDSNGTVIQGVFRGVNGSLIIDNKQQYQTALEQKKRADAQVATVNNLLDVQEQQSRTINTLSNEISELKDLITKLLSSEVINKE